jgi:hypothetical protein
MNFLNAALVKLFGGLLLPVRPLGPWPTMVFVSLLTGFLMLGIFRWTSNQAGIRRAKDRIKAHLLEARLFKDDFGQSIRAQGRVLAANGRYLGYAVKPMLVMIVPVMLLLVQLDVRFGARPLRAGEETLVRVRLAPGTDPVAFGLELEPSDGAAATTPALRIADSSEVLWRIRAGRPGRHDLVFRWPAGRATKSLSVETPALAVLSTKRTAGGLLDRIVHPGEPALPRDGPIEAIEVGYPAERLSFFGGRMHWLVAYLGLSVLLGFAFKGVLKVEV